ncbi:MAG: oligosaccharide flippase family protein [Chitinophagales bacterium]
MSVVKKLASDTVVYGLSSIIARVINFLFGFLIIKFVTQEEFGIYTNFYAYAGFILIVLTHGMETAFFRFINKEGENKQVFATAFYSVLIAVVLFILFAFGFQNSISNFVKESHLFIQLFALIMSFDALAAIPFAKLRADNRPLQFAFLKILNIVFFIGLCLVFFYNVINVSTITFGWIDNTVSTVSYIFIANLFASLLTLVCLIPKLSAIKFGFNLSLHKKMFVYALPIMLIGLAGMVNQMLDRVIMVHLLPYDDVTNKVQLGIYGFNYKFAMIISMFLQAYRYAAEPIFFKAAQQADNKQVYARTMLFFVICACVIFLLINLFMPIIQQLFLWYSPNAKAYFVGAKIIPILLAAYLCFGMYFSNITWYKIKTNLYLMQSFIAGAVITIVLNIILVPKLGYIGASITTFVCAFSMLLIGYITEQKYYPIPYNLKRIALYIFTSFALYGLFLLLNQSSSLIISTAIGFVLFTIYLLMIYFLEVKTKSSTSLKKS